MLVTVQFGGGACQRARQRETSTNLRMDCREQERKEARLPRMGGDSEKGRHKG